MRAAYAVMAPTTCSGFSAAIAARSFAPAESGAGVDAVMMAGSLRLRADLYDRATDHLAVDVSLKGTGQIGKRQGAADDAIQVAWLQIAGDALPHLEPLGTWRGRGVDAQQVHAAQDEGHHRGPELGASGETHAGDVPPEIHVAGEAGQHLAAD